MESSLSAATSSPSVLSASNGVQHSVRSPHDNPLRFDPERPFLEATGQCSLGTFSTLNPLQPDNDAIIPPGSTQWVYGENLRQAVLGATAGLLLILVLATGYALYDLSRPYRGSIAAALLLSTVLHPTSRLRSSLYTRTCVTRMERVRKTWTQRHGRLGAVVGSWLALPHFVSFIAMQCTFVFGLSKLRSVRWYPSATDDNTGVADPSPPSLGDEPSHGCTAAKVLPRPTPKRIAACITRQNPKKGSTGAALPPSSFPVVGLPSVPGRRLVTFPAGRRLARWLAAGIGLLVGHALVGWYYVVLLHTGLFLIFALTVPCMSAESFVRQLGRLWRFALVFLLLAGLAFNLAADVLSISGAVRHTTAVMVRVGNVNIGRAVEQSTSGGVRQSIASSTTGGNPTDNDAAEHPLAINNDHGRGDERVPRHLPTMDVGGGATWAAFSEIMGRFIAQHRDAIEGFLTAKLPDHVLSDLVSLFNVTDAKTVMTTPRLVWWRRAMAVLTVRASANATVDHTAPSFASVDLLSLSSLVAHRLLPMIELFLQFLVWLGSNLLTFFDNVYAVILLVCLFRYLVQLEHTILYYLVTKLLGAVQSECGEYHARHIEQDITGSFMTLLQSFWHLAWYHFSITFSCFKLLGLPTPCVFALLAVGLAIFPLVPKWTFPCSVAGLAVGAARAADWGLLGMWMDARLPWLLVAAILECNDEWLLNVSPTSGKSATAATTNDSVSREKEEMAQLQPFVVGTALVLGFVAYGVSGIVLGPLIIIVAKVLFDSWGCLHPTAPAGGGGSPGSSTSSAPCRCTGLTFSRTSRPLRRTRAIAKGSVAYPLQSESALDEHTSQAPHGTEEESLTDVTPPLPHVC